MNNISELQFIFNSICRADEVLASACCAFFCFVLLSNFYAMMLWHPSVIQSFSLFKKNHLQDVTVRFLIPMENVLLDGIVSILLDRFQM